MFRRLSTAALDNWLCTDKSLVLNDNLCPRHLANLASTLPTRSPSYRLPTRGTPLPYGHHLAFFHPRNPEHRLRNDGTDADFCPPEPFIRRMWAAGSMTWYHSNPLVVGTDATAVAVVSQVDKKNFDGPSPMVFVKQFIEYCSDGEPGVCIHETRSHVYLPLNAAHAQRPPKPVKDLPKSHFSFNYTPTTTTLFRFSALTWNAHHIHLDKDYAQKAEGYPERLVHGPLSALMLLETFIYHHPDARLSSFDYRAVNALPVDNAVTIHGSWTDDNTAQLWMIKDTDGVVCMTGNIDTL